MKIHKRARISVTAETLLPEIIYQHQTGAHTHPAQTSPHTPDTFYDNRLITALYWTGYATTSNTSLKGSFLWESERKPHTHLSYTTLDICSFFS